MTRTCRALAAVTISILLRAARADDVPLRDAAAALQRGDYTAAESKVRTELKIHPVDAEAPSLLGMVLDARKEFAEADAQPPNYPLIAVEAQSSYLSANDQRLHFALGWEQSADLEIRWPSGKLEKISDVAANQLVVIREGSGIVLREHFPPPPRAGSG